jgi:hypothetical protein
MWVFQVTLSVALKLIHSWIYVADSKYNLYVGIKEK